jgi:hypothetical protein
MSVRLIQCRCVSDMLHYFIHFDQRIQSPIRPDTSSIHPDTFPILPDTSWILPTVLHFNVLPFGYYYTVGEIPSSSELVLLFYSLLKKFITDLFLFYNHWQNYKFISNSSKKNYHNKINYFYILYKNIFIIIYIHIRIIYFLIFSYRRIHIVCDIISALIPQPLS